MGFCEWIKIKIRLVGYKKIKNSIIGWFRFRWLEVTYTDETQSFLIYSSFIRHKVSSSLFLQTASVSQIFSS